MAPLSFLRLSSNVVAAEQVCLGAGAYPRGALLNHSCAPNCVLVYEGTVQVWFIKTIHSNKNFFVVLHAHLPHACSNSIIRRTLSLSLALLVCPFPYLMNPQFVLIQCHRKKGGSLCSGDPPWWRMLPLLHGPVRSHEPAPR